jgi:hypothetical protein
MSRGEIGTLTLKGDNRLKNQQITTSSHFPVEMCLRIGLSFHGESSRRNVVYEIEAHQEKLMKRIMDVVSECMPAGVNGRGVTFASLLEVVVNDVRGFTAITSISPGGSRADRCCALR